VDHLRILASLLVLASAFLSGCGESKGVQVVRLDISGTGQYSVQGEPVSASNLAAKLTELNSSPSVALHIAADHKATHQSVVGALDAAKVAGIARISFVAEPSSQK
jgi:biopolymer transport protein ExbD